MIFKKKKIQQKSCKKNVVKDKENPEKPQKMLLKIKKIQRSHKK